MKLFTILRVATLVLLWVFARAATANADPLFFNGTTYLINAGGEKLDLFTNPDVILEPQTYGGTIYPPALSFSTIVKYEGGPSLSDTVRFTFAEEGSAPVVSDNPFVTGPAPISMLFPVLFRTQQAGRPLRASLRVDLLNSSPDFVIPSGPDAGKLMNSYTYSFQTLTPTPEPAGWVLLASGGMALLLRRRRLAH
jgi:hypothetical protein